MNISEHLWNQFVASVKQELDNIGELRDELNDTLKREDVVSKRRVIGSILHDFYNCCERIFKKIAVELNGGMGRSDMWHRELLCKMTTTIDGARPRVITDELAAELDDFLAFRHVFRNIYGFELKGERIIRLAKKFDKVSEQIEKQIELFLKEMES